MKFRLKTYLDKNRKYFVGQRFDTSFGKRFLSKRTDGELLWINRGYLDIEF